MRLACRFESGRFTFAPADGSRYVGQPVDELRRERDELPDNGDGDDGTTCGGGES